MKEKAFSLTGDDFTVKTTAGMEVCKCKGKVMSISDKKGRLLSLYVGLVRGSYRSIKFTVMES